jgi:hypothetical protein
MKLSCETIRALLSRDCVRCVRRPIVLMLRVTSRMKNKTIPRYLCVQVTCDSRRRSTLRYLEQPKTSADGNLQNWRLRVIHGPMHRREAHELAEGGARV